MGQLSLVGHSMQTRTKQKQQTQNQHKKEKQQQEEHKHQRRAGLGEVGPKAKVKIRKGDLKDQEAKKIKNVDENNLSDVIV